MGGFTSLLSDVGLDELRQVGGKAANLGHLIGAGFPVPKGFCVLARAYESFLADEGLERRIDEILSPVDFGDLAAVEGASAAVRGLLVSSAVPERAERDILDSYGELVSGTGKSGLVAVRSSVGTKDLALSSFPGQMETYHNVTGGAELLRKVKECWASVFSYAAMVNRKLRGLDYKDVFIAPVVQLMVAADSAGVLFTVNPLDGNPCQVVINSCFGLGEGVVSGGQECDQFVVGRESLDILEKDIGEKAYRFSLDAGAGRGNRKAPLSAEDGVRPSLTDGQVRELVRVSLRIEDLYGSPRDIEWAFQDGKLYILQARAVTAAGAGVRADETSREELGAGDGPSGEWVSEFDSTVDPDYPEYTLANISEVMPGVLSPLSISSGIGLLDYGFVEANTGFGLMKGINPKSEYTFLGVFYGHAHLNLSVLSAITAKLPGATSQELQRKTPDEEEIQKGEKFRFTPGSLLTTVRAIISITFKLIITPRSAAAIKRNLDERLAEFWQYDVEKIPYVELLEHMKESREESVRIFPLHITASQMAGVFFDSLRKATGRWLGDAEGLLASRLVTGLHNLESALPSGHIWDLSRRVKGSPALEPVFRDNEPGAILEMLRADSSPDAKGFLASLDSFLGKFGYRSVFEAEMMLPSWSEDPSFVFAMIKNYLDTDDESSPRNLARRQERERKEALAEAMERLSPTRRLLLRYIVRQAQKYIGLREFMKAILTRGIAEVKRQTHILSRRFAAEGLISEPSDIFFLTRDEVEAIMVGRAEGIPVGELVARRRLEHERNRSVVLPEYSTGRPKPLTQRDLERELEGDFDVLRGLSVSPGKVTGRARVITDPRSNAEMKPGEILVAPVTDAAWTPLFVTAAAIVVDVGGPLSHGSIVAREYGIPGVLSVRLATRLIKTGQLITVDGDHGRVYLHPAGEDRPEQDGHDARGAGPSGGSEVT